MKHTIIYFIGVYDTLDLFTGKLREAFETMGYASFVYDARLPQSKDALLSVLAESSSPEREFSCVTFNNLGYNLDMEVPAPAQSVRENDACIQKGGTRNVWEYYGIPYLNILMDHPLHYEKPLRLAPETSVVLCTDRNHVKYIRRYFKNIHQVDFLPHAGVELGSRHKPLAERGIDVCFSTNSTYLRQFSGRSSYFLIPRMSVFHPGSGRTADGGGCAGGIGAPSGPDDGGSH